MSYEDKTYINLNNHKLVVVMDHSPYYLTSSDPNRWLDSFCQDPAPVIPKSLWACMVESVMEFTRIVWNIFPRDKLIQVIASNHLAHILNNWDVGTQSTEYLAGAFTSIGQPFGETPAGEEASILHGLRGALESLITYTPLQKMKYFNDLACMAKTQFAKLNRGRIICITSLSTETDLKILTDLFIHELSKYNHNASNSDFKSLPITQCHLIILNIYPTDTSCDIMDQPVHQVAADLKLELHTIDAMNLSNKLSQLLVLEYNLVCTVIEDIPSLNFCVNEHLYDAEMFHLRDVHLDMASNHPEAIRNIHIQESVYTKMRLRWSNQHLEITDIITSMTRITPADIKNPGAIRLIKHLYTGKRILLEYQIKAETVINVVKYMLAVQDGDIFLHTLLVPREIPAVDVEDTNSSRDDGDTKAKFSDTDTTSQSDSEKPCTQNKCSDTETASEFDSTKCNESNTDTDKPCNNLQIVCSKNVVNNHALSLKQPILYSPYVKQLMLNLLSTYIKSKLTRNQIEICCNNIGIIKSNELNCFALNLPRNSFYKNAPKSVQYRVLWNEMQQFLENNLYSYEHQIVYNFFRKIVRGEKLHYNENGASSGPSSSSDEPAEDQATRLNLLDIFVKKGDGTQRNLKDIKSAGKNK